MSERHKEFICTIILGAIAVALGLYAVFGNIALGAMSISETKGSCGYWSAICVICGAISLIGDQRLNRWINPRLEAYSKKRKEHKERRKAMRVILDLKDPSRVERREKRKKHLCCALGWMLVLSPLAAIIVSVILSAYFKSEVCYMILAICVLYAVQLWGFLLIEYLKMKKEKT